MAHMYPPELIADDVESRAEQRLFELFRERLGADYYVIHSASWHATDEQGRVSDGEADFVVIHPRHGILVLEVKGGGVTRNGVTRRWTTINANGKRAPIKDPFKQAMKSKHVLHRAFKAAPSTRPFTSHYILGHGVWFPDVKWPRTDDGHFQGLDDLALDAYHLRDPERALLGLYQHFAGPTPQSTLSDEAVDAFISQLTYTIDAKPISVLALEIDGETPRIKKLTDAQFERLRAMWSSQRQVAVPGAAGTGKTVLAMEMASRLALEGLDVLLLCANQTLADRLVYLIEQDRRPTRPQVNVHSVKSLVTTLAQRGGHRQAEIGPLRITSAENQKTLSSILTHNIRQLEQRGDRMPYDAILVDEGEDIEQALWTPIQRLLRDRSGGFFYVFYDEKQRVDLPGKWTFRPAGGRIYFPLTANCRNTRAIFELMARYNPALLSTPFEGPPGRPIQYLSSVGQDGSSGNDREVDEETLLAHALDAVLGPSGGLSPEDVLVITCRSEAKSRWYRAEGRAVGRHALRWIRRGEKDGSVPLATIRSAKGLEYKVVVLAELDGLKDEPKRDALLYVAISRAMHHLVVLGTEHDLEGNQRSLWSNLAASVASKRGSA